MASGVGRLERARLMLMLAVLAILLLSLAACAQGAPHVVQPEPTRIYRTPTPVG